VYAKGPGETNIIGCPLTGGCCMAGAIGGWAAVGAVLLTSVADGAMGPNSWVCGLRMFCTASVEKV